MSGIAPQNMALLEKALTDTFVPHLPPLLDKSPPLEQQQRKNLSRAFGAFALSRTCGIAPQDAAKAVVDDFDDYGVDAIYYHAPSETMYLLQGKLKASEQFSQEEALAFCQGIRKLIKQDFDGFNTNVKARAVEIENALDTCNHIQIVVAHTGSGISHHAKGAIDELLEDEDHGEERFAKTIINYDAARVVADLQAAKAYDRIDTDLSLSKCTSVHEPRLTYFGLVQLQDLVGLHQKHGTALYEKNIRTFLGHKTDVNASIQETLANRPKEFVYLNNGVAALCEDIEPKGSNAAKGKKKLVIRGFSVINGAQTIATAAHFTKTTASADISDARVSLTLIKASAAGDFGKSVTRARNHQNPVYLAHFVALDDEQERLRRELAHLGIHYAYKPEVADNKIDPLRIQVDEAAHALALFQTDPRFVVWLKKEPARLLDTTSEQYKALFPASLSALSLANAVRFLRYVLHRMTTEAKAASGQERLTYKHGNNALAWVLAKRIRTEQQGAKLLDTTKLTDALSAPIDQARQTLWAQTKPRTATKGPLAIFRNQTDVVPLLEAVLIEYYGLSSDVAVQHKKKEQKAGEPYPINLFEYAQSKAPQIVGLS